MPGSRRCDSELPVGKPLEVRVVHVNRDEQCLFVRLIDRQPHYERLMVRLREVTANMHKVELSAEAVRENTVYAAVVQKGISRVVLTDKESDGSTFKMFAIDVGETLQVDASQLRNELPKSVRSAAAMCIRVNPELDGCEQGIDCFASLQAGMTCMIEIS
ncbi:hypothetical protein Tcan_09418 [Toxocara canis]|uniref:Tudor domain-containing protein n=1 Tax=Toxocara canis TaxID=6265 RepID=A0A0B2VJN2_TOXCA|nr:hypothetical protein Tcan_09418 [Toxocara canis]